MIYYRIFIKSFIIEYLMNALLKNIYQILYYRIFIKSFIIESLMNALLKNIY